MKHNGTFNIAVGANVNSKTWKNKSISWQTFTATIKKPTRTKETVKEYNALSKQDRLKVKDVGGYVGAYLLNNRRKPQNVVTRQLITLDVDSPSADFWDNYTLLFHNAAILHSTHSYTSKHPRYRLIVPINREVSPDEYVAIARKVAGILGIEMFDNTTFQPYRLMFWGSASKDAAYVCEVQDGEWIDADAILAMYRDWKDSSQWDTANAQDDKVKALASKQTDPLTKRGIVGSFCRTYAISDIMANFLSDEYTAEPNGRYSYVKGSTSSGLVVYDDKFSYSHHGTDPSSTMLCNAFDLVRVHKFGHLDEVQYKDITKAKSYKAMIELATSDDAVKLEIAKDRFDSVTYDFNEDFEAAKAEGKYANFHNVDLATVTKGKSEDAVEGSADTDEENLEWTKQLEVDGKSNYKSSASNLNIILANDKRLAELFRFNRFDNKRYICRSAAWRKIKDIEPVEDVDYSGLRNYLEVMYGITGMLKIDDALALVFEKNSFHPVQDYLDSLVWDGVPRLDTLLIDVLGADDNIYVRQAGRKTIVAAVARVFNAGVKFDTVLTFVGKEGTGKSTLAAKLGKDWFSDTFNTISGKEAFEQLQGNWIIEMGELAGLRKAEVEGTKQYVSKREDKFRPAYGRTIQTFKRQCIFIATTNHRDFLKSPVGNRRFLPIDVHPERIVKYSWDLTDKDVDDIWSEAVQLFRENEKLYLEGEAAKLAFEEQKTHSFEDERKGLILRFLDTPLPASWRTLNLDSRRMYLDEDDEQTGDIDRQYVCIAEIWCECFGKDKSNLSSYTTRELNGIMKSLEGWDIGKSTKNFGFYGKQRFYKRSLL